MNNFVSVVNFVCPMRNVALHRTKLNSEKLFHEIKKKFKCINSITHVGALTKKNNQTLACGTLSSRSPKSPLLILPEWHAPHGVSFQSQYKKNRRRIRAFGNFHGNSIWNKNNFWGQLNALWNFNMQQRARGYISSNRYAHRFRRTASSLTFFPSCAAVSVCFNANGIAGGIRRNRMQPTTA